jgi:hypothetical protein
MNAEPFISSAKSQFKSYFLSLSILLYLVISAYDEYSSEDRFNFIPKTYKIPIIEVSFQAHQGTVVLSIILFIMFLSFANKIRLSRLYYNKDAIVPWSMIDASGKLHSFLSYLSFSIILISPILIPGSVALILSLRVKAYNIYESNSSYIIMSVLLSCVFIYMVIVAIRTT